MNVLSPSLDFCVQLARAHNAVARRFSGELGQGLSFADFQILLQLSRAPEGRMRRIDLAGQLGVTASAVTRTLIPLERIGLINREPDARDARVGYAVINKTGLRVLEEAMPAAEQLSKDIFGMHAQNAGRESDIAEAGAVLGSIGGSYREPNYRWVPLTRSR